MSKLELLYNNNLIDKNATEHYNLLVTNIQFSGSGIKKILITSAEENEGKSTVSINLAKTFADLGFKVLFIDADTRNSSLLSRINLSSKIQGLTSYLSGISSIENVLYSTDISNLTILPAGVIPPNPVSLLQSRKFEAAISAFEKYYDYIIIDSPPIGIVADALIIAEKCDASILIAKENFTKQKVLKKAKEQLEKSQSKFLGVILNSVDIKTVNYGKYGKYSGK